jgi:hypothetical protein
MNLIFPTEDSLVNMNQLENSSSQTVALIGYGTEPDYTPLLIHFENIQLKNSELRMSLYQQKKIS